MQHLNLKELRASKKLTIKQLSELTGIHQPHISEIENGHRPLNAETKRKILEVLEIANKPN